MKLDAGILSLSADQQAGKAEAVLFFAEDAKYFKGHFPAQGVLPAFLQIEIALKFLHAGEGLDSKLEFAAVDAAKFLAPITPNNTVKLAIALTGSKLKFEYAIVKNGTERKASSGTIALKEVQA